MKGIHGVHLSMNTWAQTGTGSPSHSHGPFVASQALNIAIGARQNRHPLLEAPGDGASPPASSPSPLKSRSNGNASYVTIQTPMMNMQLAGGYSPYDYVEEQQEEVCEEQEPDIEKEIMNAPAVGNNDNGANGQKGNSSRGGVMINDSSRHRHRSQGPSRRSNGILATPTQAPPKEAGWDVLEITGGVRNVADSLLGMSHLGALYMANNHISRLPAAIANLKNLTILDLASNRLRLLPPEVGLLMQLRHLYLQHNYLRTIPFELGRLYKLTTLALEGNPLIQEISSVYQDYGVDKFLEFLLDQLVYDCPPPASRALAPMAPSAPTTPTLSSGGQGPRMAIAVMCYNVLCGQYCSRAQYGYCPSWALDWEYRKKGIMNEIRRSSNDLICLQEVETEQYLTFFVPQLKLEGFQGCFVPKSRSKTMHQTERSHVDGCAIFFNTHKFEFVEEYTVEFSHLAMSYAHNDGCITEASENMLNRVMPKDNVGIVALLRVRNSSKDQEAPSKYLLVVNVHVHWDPEYCDVKLIQTIMMSWRLREIALQVSRQYLHMATPDAQQVPIIFTGDMNSLADSGVLEFFLKGHIPYLHKDFRGIRYKQCISRYSAGDKEKEQVSHGLELSNAYDKVDLHYTNYTLDFKGVIDYIFYSSRHFVCTGVLRPLDRDWLDSNRIVGFPHPHIPSDHIPLLAHFEMLL